MLSEKWVVCMWLCLIMQLFYLVSEAVYLCHGRSNAFESSFFEISLI